MATRTTKQIYIGSVFIILIALISWSLVDYVFITEATCSDGIKNGKEEGIDCGTLACGFACPATLEPITVLSKRIIEVSENDYDVLIEVANPNGSFGSGDAIYNLRLVDLDGNELASRDGSFYIMPGQTRNLIIQSIKTEKEVYDIYFDVVEVNWQELKDEDLPKFEIRRNSLLIPQRPGIYAELESIVFNNSFFDFDKVDARVVLYDAEGKIVGVAVTDIRTFISNSERYFRVFWPNTLASTPVEYDVEISTNIFEDSNFIRSRGTQQRFQEYY